MIGGINADNLLAIERTSDGGYVMGGNSWSNASGDKSENCLGAYDYWIVKTDSVGTVQWENTIGGDSIDYLNTIYQTSDGGYIIGGYSYSNISVDKSENCLGGYDYWMVKLNSNGIIQWENTIGGNSFDILGEVQETPDGGFVLAGYSSSNISFDKTENRIGGDDFWILKTDALGNVIWQNTIGGFDSDLLNTLDLTSDGGFILGGNSLSGISGDKTEICFGLTDYWVVKADSVGNVEWEKTYGGISNDAMWSIEQTKDGGYILGGWSRSDVSGNKTGSWKGGWDYWVLKIDAIGNIEWQQTLGGSADDFLNHVQQAEDGGYYIGGHSSSGMSGDKVESSLGGYDYWIVKLDSLGREEWQNTIGGSSTDYCYSIEPTADGGCVVGGHSFSNVSMDKTIGSIGSNDYWIMRLSNQINAIKGIVYVDLNSNSIQDNGEPVLPNRKITEQSTGRFVFSELDGSFSLGVLNSGSYTVSPQSTIWYNPVPPFQSAVFTGLQQTDSLNDFAFQPQGTFEDVCITITPIGPFRSGFNASYMISYGNYGSTTVAPTVYFYPHSNVTFLSASVTPNLVSPDSVVWSFPPMSPFQTGSIVVTVNVSAGLPIGTLINSTAHIEPYLTDDNPSCNNSNWEVFTVGAYDPNDILVSHKFLTTTQLSTSPWLDYIIRFQNTGNDTAFTVKILNPIDTFKLNISTIEFVSASHPVDVNWINYQRNMEFKFENILLVDSNTNEPLSHGFVHYRIQPKTNLSVGDSITNFAAIYFDFNEPVITNTAKTIIVLPTGLTSATPEKGKLHVFPNPTENTLNISGIQLESGKAQLRVTDIYGKLILEKTITSTPTTLETNNLSNGIYLIQSGELRATFVKQ